MGRVRTDSLTWATGAQSVRRLQSIFRKKNPTVQPLGWISQLASSLNNHWRGACAGEVVCSSNTKISSLELLRYSVNFTVTLYRSISLLSDFVTSYTVWHFALVSLVDWCTTWAVHFSVTALWRTSTAHAVRAASGLVEARVSEIQVRGHDRPTGKLLVQWLKVQLHWKWFLLKWKIWSHQLHGF